ncbi:MAG: hypothetical protein FWG36_00310 [Oscillospiraceae bacterium]|nr:hypothetical protein [Oscillospiraceae bacterium]
MTQAHDFLYNEVSKLPVEKVDTAISFIRFLRTQQELELLIDPVEENELHGILKSGEFIGSSEVFDKIMAMPND